MTTPNPHREAGAQLYDHEKRYQAMRDAAPELYEALKALTDNINEFGQVTDPEFVDQADAALAKARGESA
jgi:hypothetical protein